MMAGGALLCTPNVAHAAPLAYNPMMPTFVGIDNVTQNEGNSGPTAFTFTITLSNADPAQSYSVNYSTIDGNATAPSDYVAQPSTTVTFAAGETSKTITITVNGDTTVEPNEQFSVPLSPQGALALGGPSGFATGIGTITNDDVAVAAPTITSFTPTSGPVGTSVNITGTDFTNVTSVKFNGIAAVNPTVNSATSITATVPASATMGKISVTTPSGTATSTNNFTVTETPSLIVTTAADTVSNTDFQTSLREAIILANTDGTASTITFSIPGTGVKTIQLGATALPDITQPVTIDGNSQGTGFKIEISGNLNGNFPGLTLASAGSTIKGLSIGNCATGIALNNVAMSGNTVSGNYIGVRADGTTAFANSTGIQINGGANNVIGGATAPERNIISGNSDYGVFIGGTAAMGNTVIGNYIGTNKDGDVALPNKDGIFVGDGSDTTIGGTAAKARNIISGNSNNGVYVGATGTTVIGNYIGTNKDGATALPNSKGIVVAALNTTIGGTTIDSGNIISGNINAGIIILGGTGNFVRRNSIFANGGLGIDLGDNGVTANDAGDADSGANNLQNFPVISSVGSNGSNVVITGTFNSNASKSYILDFYDNGAVNVAGEGKTYLGSITVTADGTDKAFTATLSGKTLTAGNFVSATATRTSASDSTGAQGDTSEFSLASNNAAPTVAPTITPTNPTTNQIIIVTPNGSDANGDTLTYTYTFSVNNVQQQTGTDSTFNLATANFGNAGDVVKVSVVANDAKVNSTAGTAQVTVANSAPTLADASFAGTVGTAFSQQLSGSDADGDLITYSATAGALPPGLTLSESGRISGAPTAAGNFTTTVILRDNTDSVSAQISFNIAQRINTAPMLNNATYSTAINASFSQQLDGRDAENDLLTYSLASGTLPTGLELSSAGVISGAATTPGRSDFFVNVSDGRTTKRSKFIIIVSSNPDGVGPTVVRPALKSSYTRDELAALVYTGTIQDTAQGNVTPSGVKQLAFQLRRPSDNTAYSGVPSEGFTSNLDRGYFPAFLFAPVPNTTAGVSNFRRTFSSFIPPVSVLTPDNYDLVILSQDNALNFSVETVPLTIIGSGNMTRVAPSSLQVAPSGSGGSS